MNVLLIGKTEFDVDALSIAAVDRKQLPFNRDVDLLPVKLSDHEKLLAALMAGQDPPSKSLDQRLRQEVLALRFLTYQFILPWGADMALAMQIGCLDWMSIPGEPPIALVQGRLSDWTAMLYYATQLDSAEVVEIFDWVYLYLENEVGLKFVMSRFHKDEVELGGKKLFRLRYQ